jgi:hypothetical protein
MIRRFVLILLVLAMVLTLSTNTLAQEPSEVNRTLGNFGVIGIHNLTLKDSTQAAAFEEFVKLEFLPAYNKIFPGEILKVAKADRGKANGQYVLLYLFDSLRSRNRYIPGLGKPSEEANRLWNEAGIQPLDDKFSEYVTDKFIGDYITIE